VRFGNVLGSRGSVLPTFRRQIERGGPVTVTDPDATRYFMTVDEAVSLLIEAGTGAGRGAVLILNMGEPVRIDDLARNLIRLSGLEPERDIAIVYTGLRPGERLNETLASPSEATEADEAGRIFVAREGAIEWAELEPWLDRLLEASACGDDVRTRRELELVMAEFGAKAPEDYPAGRESAPQPLPQH
jgi:FlaA1/EpsC-like NDP-sugar epimerase